MSPYNSAQFSTGVCSSPSPTSRGEMGPGVPELPGPTALKPRLTPSLHASSLGLFLPWLLINFGKHKSRTDGNQFPHRDQKLTGARSKTEKHNVQKEGMRDRPRQHQAQPLHGALSPLGLPRHLMVKCLYFNILFHCCHRHHHQHPLLEEVELGFYLLKTGNPL